MELYCFDHQREIKPGCCGWRTPGHVLDGRNPGKGKGGNPRKETPNEQEPHGLCGNCLAELLVTGPYSIERAENQE